MADKPCGIFVISGDRQRISFFVQHTLSIYTAFYNQKKMGEQVRKKKDFTFILPITNPIDVSTFVRSKDSDENRLLSASNSPLTKTNLFLLCTIDTENIELFALSFDPL